MSFSKIFKTIKAQKDDHAFLKSLVRIDITAMKNEIAEIVKAEISSSIIPVELSNHLSFIYDEIDFILNSHNPLIDALQELYKQKTESYTFDESRKIWDNAFNSYKPYIDRLPYNFQRLDFIKSNAREIAKEYMFYTTNQKQKIEKNRKDQEDLTAILSSFSLFNK